MDNPASESSNDLVDAFSSYLSDESPEESGNAVENESPEAAAERLLQEDANQNEPADGEKEPEGEAADDGTVEIEVDGKPVKLTKTELAEHYKNGLRQKDYTQKTMEVSEHRKAADAEIQRARAERENYAQQLSNFAITSESILAEQSKALTEDLLRADPIEYLALKSTFEKRQADLVKAQSELSRITGEKQHEQAEAQAAYGREQLEKLQAKLPAFKDAAKAKVESERIKGYLADNPDLGFTLQEIASLGDHRFVLIADKAQKYDALIARAKDTTSKVQKAPPKVERPGSSPVAPTDGRTRLMKELSATGSKNAAAQLFEHFV